MLDVEKYINRFNIFGQNLKKIVYLKKQNKIILIYKFIPNRQFRPNSGDVKKLACALKNFHKALKNIFFRKKIQKTTKEKIKIIRKIFPQVLKNKYKFLTERQQETIKNEKKECLKILTTKFKAQATHGDLHCGNVLFKKTNDSPTLIDFEETPSSFYSVFFDVAVALERFILQKNISFRKKQKLSKEFINCYSHNTNDKAWFKKNADSILKAVNMRSLCILWHQKKQGIKVQKKEINKFINNLSAKPSLSNFFQ